MRAFLDLAAAEISFSAASDATAISISNSIPCAKSEPGCTSHAKIGAVIPASRSATASSRRATPRYEAPADSAALATGMSPWP